MLGISCRMCDLGIREIFFFLKSSLFWQMQELLKCEKKFKKYVVNKQSKVDHEGHMYGSVGAGDVVDLIAREYQVSLERKNIALKHPIKATGVHEIPLKLKEGVFVTFTLKVLSEEAYKHLAE